VKHILGTMKVCTLWDPISFTKYIKMYIVKIKSYISIYVLI